MARKEIEVDVTADVREATDQLEQVDRILDRLEEEKVEIPIDADTTALQTKARDVSERVDKMTDSARGANSALANMVGNSAQDLGALGGFAGSAGVAIGQMAEYASDATLAGEGLSSALGSMAGVALPIAGLTAGVALLNLALGDGEDKSKAIAESTNTFADALFRAADGGERLQDVLKSTASSEVDDFLGGLGDKTIPFVNALGVLRVNYGDVVQAFQTGRGPVADALGDYRNLATEVDRIKFNEFVDTNDALRLFAQRSGQSYESVKRLYEAGRLLNDVLGDQALLSAEGADNAQALARFRDGETIATQHYTDALARLNTESDRDGTITRDKLPDLQAEADAQQRRADAADNYYDSLARLNTEEERVDRARDLKEEETNLRALASVYDELLGKLSTEGQKLRLVAEFERVRSQLADGNLTLAEAGILLNNLKTDVARYGEEVLKLPKETIVPIIAKIDTGNLTEAEKVLLGYQPSPTVQVPLEPVISLAQAQRQFGPNLTPREIGTNIPTAPGSTTNFIINPPGTPAATVDQFNLFITRNGERQQL